MREATRTSHRMGDYRAGAVRPPPTSPYPHPQTSITKQEIRRLCQIDVQMMPNRLDPWRSIFHLGPNESVLIQPLIQSPSIPCQGPAARQDLAGAEPLQIGAFVTLPPFLLNLERRKLPFSPTMHTCFNSHQQSGRRWKEG